MKKLLFAALLFLTTNCMAQSCIKFLPACGKYNIHLKNDCHWLLASRTKWILGYVVITNNDTVYFDLNANEIDKSKVLGYGRLQRRKSKNKCYKNEMVVN